MITEAEWTKFLEEDHKINRGVWQENGLSFDKNYLYLSYFSPSGEFLYKKTRENPSYEGKEKYKYPPGSYVTLYLYHKVRDKSSIILTEGELDTLTLISLGFPATTAGGTTAFKKEFISYFKGKKVCICFDNDDPGKKAAQKVADLLANTGIEVWVAELPQMEGGKDIGDYFRLGHTKEEFNNLLSNAQRIKFGDFKDQNNVNSRGQNQSKPKDDEEELTQTEQVIQLISEGDSRLFHDQFNDAYLAPLGNGKLILKLRSRQARSWLTYLYWKTTGDPVNPNNLNTAIQILEVMALYEEPQIPLSIRVAKESEVIWYDLGGKAVQITAQGWDVIEELPILFRRFPHQKTQVEPKRGGRLEDLLNFINLERQANGKLSGEQLLVLCWLVFGLVPELPHPAPILNGPQGSKKSTFHKVMKALLDPSSVEVKGCPRDLTEFVQTASHHWFLILDNVTSLKEWLSDAICRIITGGGFSKRELYSDDEDILYNFQHILAINGINLVVEKADLLERSLIFGFKRTKKFKTEKVFWAQFEERKPYLLGAMFDILVKTLQILATTLEPEGEFRMADFAHWGSAIAQALGYSAENFLEAYKANISNQNKEALEASPVGTAIIYLMSDIDRWDGTPTELLSELEKIAPQHRIDLNHQSWPKDARWVWRRISEVLPNLEAEDIKATKDKDDTRLIILERIPKNDVNDDDNDGSNSSPATQTEVKDNTDNIFVAEPQRIDEGQK